MKLPRNHQVCSIAPFLSLAVCASVALLSTNAASAAVISVNLTSSGAQSTIVNPGYGLWAEGGNTWNTGRLSSGTSSSYVDSGGNATTVALTLSWTAGGLQATNNNNGWGPDDLTVQGTYGGNNANGANTATISGLGINQPYELLFYHAANNANETETANGVSPEDFTGITTTADSDVYEDGFGAAAGHFLYYSSVSADGSGDIVILMDGVGYETVTGFQIRSVPEPSSTALLGLGGLALMLRRRK
jgi:hypothetical protein